MRTLRQQMRWIMLSVAILFVLSIFAGTASTGPAEVLRLNGIQDYAVAEVNGKKIMRTYLEESLTTTSSVRTFPMSLGRHPRLRRDTRDGSSSDAARRGSETQGVKPTEAYIDKAVAKNADNFRRR